MKKYITILLLMAFVLPTVASASWWNPSTWAIFHKQETIAPVQSETKGTQDEIINELQKQIDDLKNKPTDSTPKTIISPKEIKKATPTVNNSSGITAQQATLIAKQIAEEQARLNAVKLEQDALIARQKAEEQAQAAIIESNPEPAADHILNSFFGYGGKLNTSGFYTLSVGDYVKNHKASLNKGVVIFKGLIVEFNQGGGNYINVIDMDTFAFSRNIEFSVANDNDYTKITNKLDLYDRVIIYGYGINSVKFNVEGNGGSYESYMPAIETLAIYKCSDKSQCFNSGEMGNEKVFEKRLRQDI